MWPEITRITTKHEHISKLEMSKIKLTKTQEYIYV
jgi:hypothetical protein